MVVNQGLEEGQEVQLLEPEDAGDYQLTGFEIYADMKRKAAEKAAEDAARKKEHKEEKGPEIPQGMELPTGVTIISDN